MRHALGRVVAGVVGAVVGGIGAGAQGPLAVTEPLLVNAFTTGAQNSPDVEMADDGKHIVVWRSAGADGNGDAVRFRIFPGDGSVPFNEGELNQQTPEDQLQPAIAVNGAGGWGAVWLTDAAGQGVRARRSNPAGTTLGNEFDASQNTTLALIRPDVARGDDDRFLVAWELGDQSFYRLFGSDGTALTDDTELLPATGNCESPAVAALPIEGAVAVCEEGNGSGVFVVAQRLDADGLPDGPEIEVGQSAPGSDVVPSVAATPERGFVVAWENPVDAIYVRRFDDAGLPLTGDVTVVENPFLAEPKVAVSPDGAFVVAYRLGGIFAREFDRLARPVGEPFQVDVGPAGPVGARVGAGRDRFVVAWTASDADGSSTGVMRRLYRFRSVFADDFESGDTTGWTVAQ